MESSEPEIWRDIPSFEGFYQVSSHGRVRSIDRTIHGNGSVPRRSLKSKVISPHLRGDSTKYPTVLLSVNGKKSKLPVHQAVLRAFHGPRPSPNHVARHLNDVETDARAVNLAWGTQSENMKDKFRNGYIHPATLLSEDQRNAIRSDNRPQRAIAKEYGVSQRTVFRAKKD